MTQPYRPAASPTKLVQCGTQVKSTWMIAAVTEPGPSKLEARMEALRPNSKDFSNLALLEANFLSTCARLHVWKPRVV